MKILDSIARRFSRNGHTPKRHTRARYDAAWQNLWRSPTWMAVQSAAKDIACDRHGLMMQARRWDQNSPLVQGALEKLATHTIGCGLNPIPASGSSRWNAQVSRKWLSWARRPEITDRFSFGTVQRILWRSALRDGDSFLLLTRRDDGSPAIQMIEAHRIGEPKILPKATLEPGDGVIRDANGKHVGYQLIRETDGAIERVLDGEAVVQVLLPQRPDQPRGATIFAGALKMIHNLDDILALEQAAVKDASTKVDIIKTASGELPIEMTAQLGPDDVPAASQDAAGYYKDVFGPESKVLMHGDEWNGYEPKRPGPAWQGFVDFLVSMIGFSTGLPPTFILPAKIGGADTRAILASAARTLEVWQWMQADAYQRVFEYVVGAWIDRGEVGNAPKDWRECNWQMPKSITADAGRDVQADIDRVRSGLLSLEDYFGEQGYDGRRKIEQMAAEQTLVHELDETGELARRLYETPGKAQVEPEEEEDEQPENTQRNDADETE